MNKFIIQNGEEAGKIIASITEDISKTKEKINMGLPGGRSIISVINFLYNLDKKTLSKIYLFLIDERLNQELNQDLLLSELDDRINKSQICFPKITGNNQKDFENYNNLMIKNPLDIAILGVGEDCHIASIFPNSEEITSSEITSLVLNSPKPPKERITLTLHALRNSKNILLFLDDKKKALLDYENNYKNENYPASYIKEESIVITNIK